jgi:hypothetical protein
MVVVFAGCVPRCIAATGAIYPKRLGFARTFFRNFQLS